MTLPSGQPREMAPPFIALKAPLTAGFSRSLHARFTQGSEPTHCALVQEVRE